MVYTLLTVLWQVNQTTGVLLTVRVMHCSDWWRAGWGGEHARRVVQEQEGHQLEREL